jgi:hypothetical protein
VVVALHAAAQHLQVRALADHPGEHVDAEVEAVEHDPRPRPDASARGEVLFAHNGGAVSGAEHVEGAVGRGERAVISGIGADGVPGADRAGDGVADLAQGVGP